MALFEFLFWLIIVFVPAYGGIVATLKLPEIARYRKEKPSSAASKIHDLLIYPWVIEQKKHALPSSDDFRHLEKNDVGTVSFNVSKAYIIDIKPGTIWLPFESGHLFFFSLFLAYMIAVYLANVFDGTFSFTTVYPVVVIAALTLVAIALVLLAFWKVLDRWKLYITENSLFRIGNYQYKELFVKIDRLNFYYYCKRIPMFGEFYYVAYKNEFDAEKHLFVCPKKYKNYLLKETPEDLVNNLNNAIAVIRSNLT